MGTALTLFETPALDILWPDLDVVPMVTTPPPKTPDDPATTAAARRLLVFLDLVAHRAASLHRFLLNPDFVALLVDGSGEPESA